jgi:glutathione synthase/RimK-type ligase-like ATP-grasp enzyme
MILIVTATNDLHAVAVQNRVRALGYRDIHIVECDRIAQRPTISFRVDSGANTDKLLTPEGRTMSVSDAGLIWLRRMRADQLLDHDVSEPAAVNIMNNDCRGSLSSFLATKFRGKWISDPESSIRASDKIYQLTVAEKNGFKIPKTLVSQRYDDVSKFFDESNAKIIAKTVVGVSEPFLQTIKIDDVTKFDVESYQSSPAIYQELIEGTDHLRLVCFGDKSLCGCISTTELDWRLNLKSDIKPWDVPDELHQKVRSTLDDLGLEMGIVDIKIDPHGNYVWFEVNPQGQFIFLEPLTNIDFVTHFANYLIEEVKLH